MRTKILLSAVAALAVGVASSMAQTTYSQNIVGYVNTVLPVGYSMICAPVSNATTSAEVVLPCLVPGDQLLIWNGGGYDVDLYGGPGAWYDGVSYATIPVPVINSGQGFFYQNNNAATTNTFVGTVVLSNSVALPVGYALVASTAPVAGSIESTNFNLPFQAGDQVLIWNGGGYDVDLYGGPGAWYDGVSYATIPTPTLTVGQGFFYQNNNAAGTWQQNVIVQ
jgi:hypothetical protein